MERRLRKTSCTPMQRCLSSVSGERRYAGPTSSRDLPPSLLRPTLIQVAERFNLYPLRRHAEIDALALANLNFSITCLTIKAAILSTSFLHLVHPFHCLRHGQLSITALSDQPRLPLRHAWLLGAESTPQTPIAAAHLRRMQTSHQRHTHGRKSPRANFIQQGSGSRLYSTLRLGCRQLRH